MTERLNNNKTDSRSSTSSNGGAAALTYPRQITESDRGQGAGVEREGEGTYPETLEGNQKR